MLIDDGTPAGGDFVERTVPRNATQAIVIAHLRIQQAAVQRYRLAERRAFYAQAPLVGGMVDIAGDIEHPANQWRLCVKGSALGETVSLEGRLLYPQVRDDAGLRRVSWDSALDKIVASWRAIIDEHGPDAVALYVSGQLLTEDYYIANTLMKHY